MKVRNGVRCDVCGKSCGKEFRAILIHVTNFKERYIHMGMAGVEKELDVCNFCVDNLNFRPLEIKRGRLRGMEVYGQEGKNRVGT